MKRVFDYVSADAFLGKKNERPFAHNTRIERHEDGSIMAKYHGNIVADFYPDRGMDQFVYHINHKGDMK